MSAHGSRYKERNYQESAIRKGNVIQSLFGYYQGHVPSFIGNFLGHFQFSDVATNHYKRYLIVLIWTIKKTIPATSMTTIKQLRWEKLPQNKDCGFLLQKKKAGLLELFLS